MNFRGLILFTFFLVVIVSCKKGNPVAHTPPKTVIFVDTISLSGKNRLEGVVPLKWSGYSSDGYIASYEISINGSPWKNIGSTEDSTFTFKLIQGQDSSNINFCVRAVDNYGIIDPSPPCLVVPVKDTPPTVALAKPKTDTAYVVFTMTWTANDIEGAQAIDSIFIKINSGKWFALSSQADMVTFVPANAYATGATTAKVYMDSNAVLLPQQINGLLLNDTNRIYIKARDISGEYSNVDSTETIYFKNQTSDLLVIGADGNSSPKPQNVYFPLLSAAYGKFDFVDYETNGAINQPLLWSPTFTLYISLYDKIFIYTDSKTYGVSNPQLLLQLGASSFQTFLNKGGKLLILSNLPSSIAAGSNLYQFLPLDSLASSSLGIPRISTGNLATPDSANAAQYPVLISSANVSLAVPFYPQASALVLYNASITKGGRPVQPWEGPTCRGAKTHNSSSKTNMIFFSMELYLFDGNNTALQQFFSQVMNDEFNW